MLPWSAAEISRYPWHAVPDLLGDLVAVIFVTAISTLFNTTGIEVAAHREADLERELNVTGLANMLSGAFGGYTGCISVSRTILNFNSGGTGRLVRPDGRRDLDADAGGAPVLLGYMPKFVLGGLLIYLGADQLHKWIVESRRRLTKTEYLSLLAIIVIILQWGFVAGVLIGIVIGCATFALSAARIDSIKFSFDGSSIAVRWTARATIRRCWRRMAARSRASTCRAICSSVPPTGFTSTSRRCWRGIRNAAFWCSTSSSSPAFDSSAAYSFAQIKRTAHDLAHRTGAGASCPSCREGAAVQRLHLRTTSASCLNSIMRWSNARTRSLRSIRATSRRKPICATGSRRFSEPSMTPRR